MEMNAGKKSQAMIGPAEDGFVLEDYALYNLVRTASTYMDEMEKTLKLYRLDTMKWRILMLLHDKSPSSVSELARRSVTKMPTLTRVLIRMEKEGLIMRQTQAIDKRVVQVTMTSQAMQTLHTVQAIGQKLFERTLEGFSPLEVRQFTQTLKRMRSNLNRSPYEPAASDDAFLKAGAL